VEHDLAWHVQAEEELRRLDEVLGPVALRLEHVGSTAVPGLAAKPVLDLQRRAVRRTRLICAFAQNPLLAGRMR
jgi:GrpB-like predicted nucleotidyltransferase (UPF0157 family)